MNLGVSDSCVMSAMVLESILSDRQVCINVIDVTVFSNSVQSCQYVSIPVFLCAFQLISVLQNLI